MSDNLLPVGRDCPCGHPLVLRDGVETCSVYGSHRAPIEAPGARLVRLSMSAPNNTRIATYARHVRHEARQRRLRAVS